MTTLDKLTELAERWKEYAEAFEHKIPGDELLTETNQAINATKASIYFHVHMELLAAIKQPSQPPPVFTITR
jgi:hypothetical protein